MQTPTARARSSTVTIDPHTKIARYGMPQVRIPSQQRTAGARWRRHREPVLALDPRDGDVVRAKHLQRQRGGSAPGDRE